MTSRRWTDELRLALAADCRRVTLVALVATGLLSGGPATYGDEPADDQRERVRQMSPAEKEQLRRRQERFDNLDPQQKERLRKLHDRIEHHPRCEELQRAMGRYHAWLKKLTPAQRADLRKLSAQERIAKIRKLQQEQQQAFIREQGRKNLCSKDLQAIIDWAREYAHRQEQRVLQEMSEDERTRFENAPTDRRRRSLFSKVWKGALYFGPGQSPQSDKLPKLTEADFDALAESLSPEARKEWDRAKSNDQRTQLAAGWVQVAIWASFRQSYHRHVSKEDLEKFFDKLPKERRDFLLGLSREEMQRALLGMYQRNSRHGRRGGSSRRPNDGELRGSSRDDTHGPRRHESGHRGPGSRQPGKTP